jgi:hypothetical protein
VTFIMIVWNLRMMGKTKLSLLSGLKKNIQDEIVNYFQHHLMSKSIIPSNIACIQVVAGGNHGDTAYQFGASVSIHLTDNRVIEFEVSVCELICHKDTGKLIETTILPRLTRGLEIVATWHLHIKNSKQGQIKCEFKDAWSINLLTIDTYVTGNLAFQAMALGKELMAGWWCMLCKLPQSKFMDDDREMWTMDKYVRCGLIAKNSNNKLELGVKKRPWWPFIPLTNYATPLLHCEFGVGNVIFEAT